MEMTARLTGDAKISTLKNDKQVVNFNVAINDSYKAKGSAETTKIVTYVQCDVRTYKNDEAKLKSLLFGGTGQLRTQKAFQLCESFAKAEVMEFYN